MMSHLSGLSTQHSGLIPFRFPLEGELVFLLRVAVLAGGNEVALGRAAATNERHEMVHRQLLRRELLAAVVADAGRAAPLPPLRLPQLACLGTLALDLFVGQDRNEGVHGLLESSSHCASESM